MHPTISNEELYTFVDGLKQIVENIHSWEKDYTYDQHTNEFKHFNEPKDKTVLIKDWFEF